MKIENGTKVKIHYTGKLSNGEVFDSTIERNEPLEINIGSGELIKGLEDALMGMNQGDKTEGIVVSANEGYGERIESAVEEVPSKHLPPNAKEGSVLQSETEKGVMLLTVMEINGDKAKIDTNHPLAGKELTFDVEVVEVTKN